MACGKFIAAISKLAEIQMKLLTTLTILSFLVACEGPQEKHQIIQDSLSTKILTDSSEIEEHNTKKTSVIKDNILEELLDFPGMGEKIGQITLPTFEIVKIPERNTHNPEIIDTIFQYKNKSNDFKFYKAAGKYILYNFNINENPFSFKNGIKLGITQQKFLKTLNLEAPKSDTIVVEDSEGFSTVNFVFKNERLVSVIYNGYLD